VATNGTWSVTYPASQLPPGEAQGTITVTATDAAGNTATTTRTVQFDRATEVSVDPGQAGGDNIIATAEHQAGVTLTGRAEAGATLAVTMEGVTRNVTAGADGTWAATFARAEIPQGSYDTTVSVTATDTAGNTATASHPLRVETEVGTFTKTTESTGADGVLNAAEAAMGLALTGTVEPGSAVAVRFGNGAVRSALVAADGSWSVTIPASEVPAGETTVPLTMTATDRLGNVSSLTETVDIDTLLRNFARTGGTIGGDGVLNLAEVGQGLPLAGTVEAGSTVVVRLSNGAVRTVVAGPAGEWSVAFAAADLPRGEAAVTAELTATDRAGNTTSLTETFRIDTVAPGSPEILSFRRDANGLRDIGTVTTDDSISFARIDGSGVQTTVLATQSEDAAFGETNFRFDTPVPDGSYLVVNTGDGAGNRSSTLFIVDNSSATTVNLSRPGLANFDFAAVDLTFAPDARMTITEAQLTALTGPDQQLIVKGGRDDSVTMIGAVATGQTIRIDGERYDIFTLGSSGASVLLDDDIRTVI
jgi:hypothetical protein